MGKGRTLLKKPRTRLKKAVGATRRRRLVHRRRLAALGMSEEKLKHLTPKAVRTMLQRPVKTKKLLAKQLLDKPSQAK